MADLCLFTPFGIGYAFTYSEIMEMDTDLAMHFYEKKGETINAFTSKAKVK